MCEEKVKYLQNGEEKIQYVGSEGHDWWSDFDSKWEHTEIVEFIPVAATDEQLARFDEVNQLNVPEGFGSELSNYVESGTFPEGINHPLINLENAKRIKNLEVTVDVLAGGVN